MSHPPRHRQNILPGVNKTRSRCDPIIGTWVRRRAPNAVAGPRQVAFLYDDRGSSLRRNAIQLLVIRLAKRLPADSSAPVLARFPPQHPRQRLKAIRGGSATGLVATPVQPGLDPDHVPVLDRRRAQERKARQPGVLDVARGKEDHGAAPEHDVQPTVARDHGARPQEVTLLDRDARRQDHGPDRHWCAADEVHQRIDEECRVVA